MDLSKCWTLGKIASAVKGKLIQGNPEAVVSSISIDSRLIKKGEVFWVVEGARFNGNDFVKGALKRQAQAAVVSRDFSPGAFHRDFGLIRVENPSQALGFLAQAHRLLFEKTQVVAVTGSNGKTTTKEMIGKVLAQQGQTFISPGNFNNEIGCPLAVLELEAKHDFTVFELAARKKGDIEYLARLTRPHVAVLTNVCPAHLETFKSLDAIFETKSEILKGLMPRGLVVYWHEDRKLAQLPKLFPQFRYSSFGFSESACVRGEIKKMSPEGTTLEVFHEGKSQVARLKTIGRPQSLNALAAFACGLSLGVPVKRIIKALEGFRAFSLRGEVLDLKNKNFKARHKIINDAYNANPISLREGVLGFLEAYKDFERIVVLGEMRELGSEELDLHKQTAQEIARAAQERFLMDSTTSFIAVGGELAQAIAKVLPRALFIDKKKVGSFLKERLSGAKEPCALYFKASRAEALETIIEELKSDKVTK